MRKTITLSVDGQSRTITTYALTVGGLLRLEDVPLAEQDSLDPPVNNWLKNHQTVNLVRAIPIQIWADDRLVSFTSHQRIPKLLLTEANLALGPGDRILTQGRNWEIDQPFPEKRAAISMQILRAVNFSLVDEEQTYTLTSSAITLGQALEEAARGKSNVSFFYPQNANHVLKHEPRPRETLTPDVAMPNYNGPDAVLDSETLSTVLDWLGRHAK